MDVGYGGYDSGVVGNGLKEKDVNFVVVKFVNSKFFVGGVILVMVRFIDVFLEFFEWVVKVKSNNVNLFVSIYVNLVSFVVMGIEIYYYIKYEVDNSKWFVIEI